MANDTTGRVTLRVRNGRPTPCTVVLEPWTGEYTLYPGKTFDVVAEGDLAHPLEVDLLDGRLIVSCFDSAGASMTIFQDGKELIRSE